MTKMSKKNSSTKKAKNFSKKLKKREKMLDNMKSFVVLYTSCRQKGQYRTELFGERRLKTE